MKLVRDKTPSILNGTGESGELFYGACLPEERLRWLRLKLAEEVAEYLVDGGADELSDVLPSSTLQKVVHPFRGILARGMAATSLLTLRAIAPTGRVCVAAGLSTRSFLWSLYDLPGVGLMSGFVRLGATP